jgi:molybdopterin/thiamine biosynthesis adenylyltransferase
MLVMLYNPFMNEELSGAIGASAVREEKDGTSIITHDAVRRLSSQSGTAPLDIEISALEVEIIPLRYKRNIGTLGLDGQLKLLRSCVGVCGLGGLGGYVVEFLARMGIGHLILADGDSFEEDNLNRQILCTEEDLGRPKVERAVERVSAVNSSLKVVAHHHFVKGEDVPNIYGEAQVIVDALDTVSSRLALEEGCTRMDIPLVHGAIAGEAGQVMTIFPGDPGLKALYSAGEDHGVETLEGNPATTPALIASIQTQEVIKILCGGELLRNGFLLIDTSANLYEFIPLKSD